MTAIELARLIAPIIRQRDNAISQPSPANEKQVFVIDDDADIRSSLSSLLRSVGLQTTTFSSAAEFLSSHKPDMPSCLVLDVRLPGIGGIEFQAELAKANIRLPIIFITGYGDIPMTVQAMKAGAVEFLTKPFRDQDLLDAVRTGLYRDRARREREQALSGVVAAYETLTLREKEVFPLVTSGLMNKQIAAKLGVSEITVKVHRGNIMRKMGARSLAALVRMADLLGVRQQEG
jgi:FixJ family two-component response regulator